MSPIREQSNPTKLDRSSLVGEWLLDGSGVDTSGNGNDGTPTNVTWVGADKGYVSEVADLNGTSAYFNMGNVLDENGSNPFSLSLWIKTSSTANQMIFGKQLTSGTFAGYVLWYNSTNGTLEFDLISNGSGNGFATTIAETVTDGIPHHVVITYDGSKTASTGLKMYLDGIERTVTVAYDTLTGSTSNSASFNIGSRNNGNLPTNGELGLGRKYSKVLSQQEINTLYLEGLRKFGPFNAQQYPELLENLKVYASFLGDGLIDLENSVSLTNSGTTATTNRLGQANNSRLIGSGDFIGMDNISNISTGTILFGFTPSANIDNTINGLIRLTSSNKTGSNTGDFATYWLTDGEFNLAMEGVTTLGFTETLNADTYYLLGISWAPGSRQICLNGVSKATDTITDTAFSTASGVTTRLVDTNSATNCNLAMDFVMIYDGEKLSEAKQKEIYEITSKKDVFNFPKYSLANLNEGKVLHIDGSSSGSTFIDQSGNGNNGTQSGGVTTTQLGLNKVMTFDGVNDYISLSQTFTGDFTFITKVKFDSFRTGESQIYRITGAGSTNIGFSHTGTSGTNTFQLFVNNGTVGSSVVMTGFTPVIDTWYTIACRADGTNKKITVIGSGVEASDTTAPGVSLTGTGNIGRHQTVSGREFDGDMIDFTVYNRALTDEEIQQLQYNNFITN